MFNPKSRRIDLQYQPKSTVFDGSTYFTGAEIGDVPPTRPLEKFPWRLRPQALKHLRIGGDDGEGRGPEEIFLQLVTPTALRHIVKDGAGCLYPHST